MHAISQEPVPCIYAQLETSHSDSSEEEDDDTYPEIRLTPADSENCEHAAVIASCKHTWYLTLTFLLLDMDILCVVQEIFETLCQCAALNPDSNGESQASSQACNT